MAHDAPVREECQRLACAAPGVSPTDDGELGRLVAETPFSRFLVPTLDPIDSNRPQFSAFAA